MATHVFKPYVRFVAVLIIVTDVTCEQELRAPTQPNNVTSLESHSHSRSVLLKHLFTDYDPSVPPNIDAENPTVVDVDVLLNSFDSVNELNMDYTINIFLRRKWTDARFRFNSTHYNLTEISIDPHRYGDIWSPDLFFTNEKEARFHAITTPNHMIRIDDDGQVFFSSRITLTAQCPMHLDKFPMDTQTCQLVLESFAYTTDIIQFHWSQEEKEEQKQINLSQFNLINTSHHERVKSYKSGDVQRNFTRLIMEFVLERDYKYYIIQTYIPSILIVSLSWVGFWISYDSVPARITLGLLTVLTLTTQSYSILQTLPRVSYVKAIDVWMSTCLIFVFLALLEFVLVNTSHRKITRRSIKGNAQLPPRKANSAKEDDENHRIWPNSDLRASTVDKCARAFFPLAFLIFIIIYVSVYTAMSDVKYPHD